MDAYLTNHHVQYIVDTKNSSTLRMGTNGKNAIRIFVYIIRMYSNIRIEKSSMFSLNLNLERHCL